jgi:hypothetical protein
MSFASCGGGDGVSKHLYENIKENRNAIHATRGKRKMKQKQKA